MTKTFSKDKEKRIYNTIWLASKSYDYIPSFVGNDIGGEPDFYFNIIIGLSVKYFGKEEINELFSLWEDSFRSDTYDILTWIALEDLLYRKEVKTRPVLKSLRKSYAENFFLDKNDPHRRRLALQNPLVFGIEVKKMEEILGRKETSLTSLSEKEKIIYERLILPDQATFPQIKYSLLETYKKYLKFDPNKKSNPLAKLLKKSLKSSTFHPLERSIKPTYLFSKEKKEESTGLSSLIYAIRAKRSKKRDRQIERIFGKSIISSKEAHILRDKYCQGPHRKSRLWYSKQEFNESNIDSHAKRAQDMARKRNNTIFEKDILSYKKQIESLARAFRSSLKSSLTSYENIADHGNLVGRLAWKSKLPKEDHIFSIKTLKETTSMAVDLVIDGSASLLDHQEDLAIEAYILAKSLELCKIPLRITAYTSVDNYTVLTNLKDFDEKASKDKIFSFYAQGWNRDGLAFRAFNKFLDKKEKENHLVLILTDANPKDLKPYETEGLSLKKSYDGKIALEDSKKALVNLRKKGVSIGAIINTSSKDKEARPIANAKYLYGRNFVSIKSVKHFSNAAKRLIKTHISEINGKN